LTGDGGRGAPRTIEELKSEAAPAVVVADCPATVGFVVGFVVPAANVEPAAGLAGPVAVAAGAVEGESVRVDGIGAVDGV